MKRRRDVLLSEEDRGVFNSTVAFLKPRLETAAAVEWALRLGARENVIRSAILHLLDGTEGRQIGDPWRLAWRFIEESWETTVEPNPSLRDSYDIRERVEGGERSGALINAIVQLVQPYLEAKPIGSWPRSLTPRKRRRPSVHDLMSVSLESGEVVDPSSVGVGAMVQREFLLELANRLEGAMVGGLDIGRRIGWEGGERLWRLGDLHRVYYVPAGDRPTDSNEPDEYNTGIAPVVKLLHAVISKLLEVGPDEGHTFVLRWEATPTPIHRRLWASFARRPDVSAPKDVSTFLLKSDDRTFWDLHTYPEVAELRALRFGDFDQESQRSLLNRLRKGPPRKHWPKDVDVTRVDQGRRYWAVREMRRVQAAGVDLASREIEWLSTRVLEFDDLQEMTRLDEGFRGAPKAIVVPPDPDSQFDLLEGAERLEKLEAALSAARRAWNDDPAARAGDWMRQPGRSEAVQRDLEAAPNAGSAYPRVWERFGWSQRRPTAEDSSVPTTTIARRVLVLLAGLSADACNIAIDGIAAWMSEWEKDIVGLPEFTAVWLRLWPFAAAHTDSLRLTRGAERLEDSAADSRDDETEEHDTLNTSAGRFVGVFLGSCPTVRAGDHPFETNQAIREMRDAVIASGGRSTLIARYRMIEALPWFLAADPAWAEKELLAPLRSGSPESLPLWSAIARRTRFAKVLDLVGEPMAARAVDTRLSRATRRSLLRSLVVDSLHGFLESRTPAVSGVLLQQTLRLVEDEVRASAAGALRRFVEERSAKGEGDDTPLSAAAVFREAVAPFLARVWPQERTLATPGVAAEFARLPAICGDAFVEAASAVERFLVRFNCWSMYEYGFHGEEGGEPSLAGIDSLGRAEALLRMLDLTIGSSEDAIVPYDLGTALEQVRRAAPKLAETQPFRRLAALARR